MKSIEQIKKEVESMVGRRAARVDPYDYLQAISVL